MNPRLKRQLLTAVISGALVATGAVSAGPAFAASPVSAVGPVLADETPATDEPTTTPTADPTTPTADPTTTPTADPTTTPTGDPTTTPTGDPTTTPTGDPTTTPTADPTTTPPAPDNAPTGSFKLNSFNLWVGQAFYLTQLGIKDDGVVDPATVGRVISWGDGTSTRIYKGWGAIGHRYARAGHFPVSLTLTDPAGHKTVIKSGGPFITVPAVKYRSSANSVWPLQVFTLTISNVPAGTTKITLDGGDGYVTNLPGRSQTVRLAYWTRRTGGAVRGPVTIRASLTNKYGTSALFYAARPVVKVDSWNPVAKLTKPSNANKASSWKTVRGTASDKGSGVQRVFLDIQAKFGSHYYCFNKGWHLSDRLEQFEKYCHWSVPVTPVNGKWSLKLGGVRKGTLVVRVLARDRTLRVSAWSETEIKITK